MIHTLPIREAVALGAMEALSVTSVVLSHWRLATGRPVFHRVLPALTASHVALGATILIFRASLLQAVPLTGLFESMVLLSTVFSLLSLFLGIGLPQAWFGVVMSWLILVLTTLGAVVAAPVSPPMAIAATPWAIMHGLAMVCGAAALTFATACGWLFLVADSRLKRKLLHKVLGRMPDVQWLRRAHLTGLTVSFVLLTVGVVCGLGMALVQTMTEQLRWRLWLHDPKVVLILVGWTVLAIHLVLWYSHRMAERAMAWVTLLVFGLLLAAVVGVTVWGQTSHTFS